MMDHEISGVLIGLAAMWIIGGSINVVFTDQVIQFTKSVYKYSPIQPVGLKPLIVKAAGWIAITLGTVAAIVGMVLLLF